VGAKMTKREFDKLCMKCVIEVRKRCPRDTGNLRDNGIQFEWLGDFKFKIYINQSNARYMTYTNEPWISPRWNGNKNQNEAWWQDSYKLLVELIIRELKGKIKDDRS
jgi:hypothetical protein